MFHRRINKLSENVKTTTGSTKILNDTLFEVAGTNKIFGAEPAKEKKYTLESFSVVIILIVALSLLIASYLGTYRDERSRLNNEVNQIEILRFDRISQAQTRFADPARLLHEEISGWIQDTTEQQFFSQQTRQSPEQNVARREDIGQTEQQLTQVEAVNRLKNLVPGNEQGSDRVEQGSDRVEQGSDRVEQGSDRVEQGSDRVEQGSDRVEQGSDRVEQGSDRVEQGSDRVEQGSDRVEQGSDRVEQGSDRVEQGSDRVEQGSDRVEQGSEEVEQGIESKGRVGKV